MQSAFSREISHLPTVYKTLRRLAAAGNVKAIELYLAHFDQSVAARSKGAVELAKLQLEAEKARKNVSFDEALSIVESRLPRGLRFQDLERAVQLLERIPDSVVRKYTQDDHTDTIARGDHPKP